MKTESPALAGQRETTCHEEKESRERPWIFLLVFCCSFIVLVRWFRLYSCASGVRSLFRAHSKMAADTFDYLHIVLTSAHSRLYLVTSPNQLILKLDSSYFRMLSEGGHIRFRWFITCTEDLGPPVFSSILSTVVIHPWLADLQRVLWSDFTEVRWLFRRLSAFSSNFLLLSLLPKNLASRSLYNLDLPYHVTYHHKPTSVIL